GNSRTTPDPVGHSSENVPGAIASGSSSPRSANAVTTLPPDCRTSPSDTSLPSGGGMPSSSVNSRRAAASGPSSLPYSPFGTVQAPASRRAQNGPPMWPSNTWGTSSTTRYSSIPALRRGAMAVLPSLVSSPRPSSARRRLVDFVTPPGHAHPTGRRRTVHSPCPTVSGRIHDGNENPRSG